MISSRPPRSGSALWGPWLLAFALFLVYGADSISRYYRSASGSYDLGIFTEAIKQYAHLHMPIVDIRAPGYNLLGDHFHPIIALLAPFFLVFPSPVTLLVGQAALFALAAVPIVWLGRDRIGPGAAYAVGVGYGLSFGVAEAVDFDFHEIAFAVPLLAFALWAMLEERTRTLLVCCFLLLLCKEDIGITFVLPIGIAVILRGRIRLGGVIAAMGVAGSLLAIYWILPHFNQNHVYEYWNKNSCVGSTTGVAHGNVVSCFWDSGMASAGTKIELVYLLLAATAFTALRSPLVLLAAVNLGLRFISPDTSFWGTAYHYNAVLMPVLAITAVDAVERARHAEPLADTEQPEDDDVSLPPPWWRRWGHAVSQAMGRHGAVAMLAASAAMVPQFAFNQFFDPNTFTFDARTAALRQAVSIVPSGTGVEATINVLAPLAAKDEAYWIGNVGNPAVQYVVLDTVVSGFSGTISDPVSFVEQRHPGAVYKVIWSDAFGIYVMERS